MEYQAYMNCRQARAFQRHQSRLRFLPAAAAADSPDTERRSGRPHHFRTAVRLFQANFVGALDNCLRI